MSDGTEMFKALLEEAVAEGDHELTEKYKTLYREALAEEMVLEGGLANAMADPDRVARMALNPNPAISGPAIQSLEEEEIAKLIRLEKRKLEAARRIASEHYTGTVELSWEDLEESQQTYLVKDLVPDDGVVFLVAKSNTGKTFAYIDMVCRMACGMPWLGKETRQAKTMIVIGEGRNGYVDRIKAWCSANGKTLADLKPWLSFMDGANLNNDESLERIREVADREAVELIVLDTWANNSGVQKEEDNALNSITLNRALTIRPGATLLLVHHPRKMDEDTEHPVMRGASALNGRADVTMTLYADHKFISGTGEKHKWIALSTEVEHAGKNRTAGTETIRGLYLDEEGDNRVLQQIASESISKASRFVREHLTADMTVAQFTATAGGTDATSRRKLNTAVIEGIAAKREGMGNRPDVYTPTGNAWLLLQGRATTKKENSK